MAGWVDMCQIEQAYSVVNVSQCVSVLFRWEQDLRKWIPDLSRFLILLTLKASTHPPFQPQWYSLDSCMFSLHSVLYTLFMTPHFFSASPSQFAVKSSVGHCCLVRSYLPGHRPSPGSPWAEFSHCCGHNHRVYLAGECPDIWGSTRQHKQGLWIFMKMMVDISTEKLFTQ